MKKPSNVRRDEWTLAQMIANTEYTGVGFRTGSHLVEGHAGKWQVYGRSTCAIGAYMIERICPSDGAWVYECFERESGYASEAVYQGNDGLSSFLPDVMTDEWLDGYAVGAAYRAYHEVSK